MKIEPHRTIRYYYLKFIRLKGDPSTLARGVAVGTFIGVTPTIPFHVILALTFSFLFRGSKVAAVLATFVVSNPVTFFPQYFLSWQIGNWLLPGKHSWSEISELINLIIHGARFDEIITAFTHVSINSLTVLIGGGIVLAIPFTIVFYFLSYVFFSTIRKKRREKKILK
ncbi:MAG: DUF2062 domain-containing protein [Desulfobulbales bacterium]